jgi:hypothetical protein
MKPYVYIIIRKDIKPCNYAPQIAHAALESGYITDSAPVDTTHIVILQVDDKIELEMVCVALEEEGTYFVEFHEGFGNMGLTAVATLPNKKIETGCLRTLELFSFD